MLDLVWWDAWIWKGDLWGMWLRWIEVVAEPHTAHSIPCCWTFPLDLVSSRYNSCSIEHLEMEADTKDTIVSFHLTLPYYSSPSPSRTVSPFSTFFEPEPVKIIKCTTCIQAQTRRHNPVPSPPSEFFTNRCLILSFLSRISHRVQGILEISTKNCRRHRKTNPTRSDRQCINKPSANV